MIRERQPTRAAAWTAVVVLAVLASVGCSEAGDAAPPAEPPATPPDLILIVVDTLRADHLSSYGYARPTSPQLDALGARGVVFEDATAQSSWTQPSMASMLTGRRLFENASRLPSAAASLAERLSAVGYETAAFVGNPAVSRVGDYDRGFDCFITRDDTGGQTWTATDLEAAVHDWLGKHPRGDAPRFLYLHFLDPHWPYEPGDVALAGEVTLDADVLTAWATELPDTPAVRAADASDRRTIVEAIDAYDREIVVADAAIGRLLALLGDRRHGVVLAADHGECLWERHHHQVVVDKLLTAAQRDPASATLRELFFRDHSYHMFEELLATPLIAAGPGLPSGGRCATPVENVDIVPTLLRMAGLPDDPALDGHALQDVLLDGAPGRQAVFSHSKEATVVRQVADGKKLIFPTDTGFSFGMPIMVFDLLADPDERHNLASSDIDALRALIHRRERAAEAFDLFDDEAFSVDDDAHRAAMRALGYVGPGFDNDAVHTPAAADAPAQDSAAPTDTPPRDGC